MCGIAGFFGEGTRSELERMIAGLSHRGPDDRGIFLERGVGLAHARLSIIDTSARGHQPMSLPDGSVTVVLNGEIYNYRALREELAASGCRFESTSDTEVVLWLYEHMGDDCFAKLAGMFAIALYDRQKDTLFLVRDRLGEKPLYWTRQGNTVLFASELGALLHSGRVPRTISADALQAYLAFDYVPTPHSIVEGVHKLEPATMLVCAGDSLEKRRYWDFPKKTRDVTPDEACAELDAVLQKTVEREMLSADVPIGVFLSGGIDSSTIAYFAARASKRPIDTFSIAFDDPSFDESAYARTVAHSIGSTHHEHTFTERDALDLVPEVPDVFSEPVADASVLPTMLLSRFARKHVTVALGGDGGDELFAGYPTFQADALFPLVAHTPAPLRSLVRALAARLPVSHGNFPLSYTVRKFLSSDARDPVERHLEWLGTFGPHEREELLGVPAHASLYEQAQRYAREAQGLDEGTRLLLMYARTYLMDQVMVKVDRASMHYALETRAPFLDHEVVECMFSLPYPLKYRRGQGKYLLKQCMRGKLPDDVLGRKKKGFGVPLARWLSGPLRPLCEELLSPASLARHGLFEKRAVRRLQTEHWDRAKDNRKELWNLMVFQLWYDRWIQ